MYICFITKKIHRFKIFHSLTNPVVKDEQIPFVNRKADGLPEAKHFTRFAKESNF